MTHEQAIKAMIGGIQAANKRGAFSLQESKVMAEAVEAFTVPAQTAQKPKDEEKDVAPEEQKVV